MKMGRRISDVGKASPLCLLRTRQSGTLRLREISICFVRQWPIQLAVLQAASEAPIQHHFYTPAISPCQCKNGAGCALLSPCRRPIFNATEPRDLGDGALYAQRRDVVFTSIHRYSDTP